VQKALDGKLRCPDAFWVLSSTRKKRNYQKKKKELEKNATTLWVSSLFFATSCSTIPKKIKTKQNNHHDILKYV
jgi:myosin-crossreactive antigen